MAPDDAPSQLDPEDVHAGLQAGDVVLVDVRDASAFAEGHATGAVNIPIDQLEQRIDELTPGTRIVTSCGGGTRGPRAAALLHELGREDVHVLRGGLRGWRGADLPVTPPS